ncbi:MAG: site-specific integrase [Firmicutes bacterium]|nr:site-specific integrase [Bacillota bacterium]
MARKGENIYKRSDGRWEGRYKCGYKENGKQRYKSIYAHSYAECRELLQQAKIEYENSKNNVKVHLTVKELFRKWLKNVSVSAKESTIRTYDVIIENHIVKSMGDIPVYKITLEHLNEFVEIKMKKGRLDNKGGLSPKTVKNIVTLIKTVFRYAEKLYGMKNPAEFITIPKADKKEIEVLTEDEIRIIKNHCTKNNDYFKVVYDLCLSTGIRLGELCALQCSDIDYENKLLTVRKTVQRVKSNDKNGKNRTKVIIDTPKSNSSLRKIPLPQKLLDSLKRFITVNEKKADDYIFSIDKKNPVDVRTIQKKFNAVLKKCNIRKVKFHILRHTFATKWANSNFDIKSLSEILGHSSINITLSLYVHPSMEAKRKIMDKMYSS